MMRFFQCLAATLVALVVCPAASRGQTTTFRDDFNAFHDFAAGTVPAGGIWNGVHNAANGSITGGLQAIFQSNGVDGFGTPKPGVLFIEDLGGTSGPFGNGIGFEGGRNTSPLPYREVDSSQDWDAKVKIDVQTAGQWSSAGIVARRAGPPVGVAPLDPAEQFVSAYSFRTDGANPGNANMLTKSIVDGVQTVDANLPFTMAGAPDPTAPLPAYVRLLKQGATLTSQSSLDGTTWFTRTVVQAPNLAAAGGMIQIGPSFMMFGAGQGSADLDFFELTVGLPTILTSSWNIAGGGNWATATNWMSNPIPGIPNNDQVEVTLGAAATANATVFTDANVTARRLVFDNVNKYAVAGTGTLSLTANSGNASIAVLQGSHEIQTAVTLGSNLTVTTAAGTRLDVNNRLSLNGKTVNITGPGTVSINNNLPPIGATGSITSSATLQGTGTVNGNLINAAGTVSPGNSAGTLTVTGNYAQVAGSTIRIELGGTAAGQFDKLVVGGSLTVAGAMAVQLIDGFTPLSGNSFDVLDFTTRTGSLTVNLPSLSPGLAWNTTNLLTTGLLSVGSTGDADFDNDGDVDGGDFLTWQRNLGLTGANNSQGDADGNGTVNAADLTIWRGTFGGAVAVSAGVPEPTAAALMALAFASLAARRRR